MRRDRPPTATRVKYWNAGQPILVTKVLIAINAVVFLYTMAGGGLGGSDITQNTQDLALSKFFLYNDEWYRLVTAGFVHFGLFHIGMNMFLLYQLGTLLEPALGRLPFTLTYFAALLAGSTGALFANPWALTGGASGAVFGLMGVAVVGMKQSGVNPFQTGLGITLLVNLLITFTIPGISIGGHLGGLVGGAACGLFLFGVGRTQFGVGRTQMPDWVRIAGPAAVGVVAFLLAYGSV